MKKISAIILAIALCLSACAGTRPTSWAGSIAPVKEFERTMEDVRRWHWMVEDVVEGAHKAKRFLDFLTK